MAYPKTMLPKASEFETALRVRLEKGNLFITFYVYFYNHGAYHLARLFFIFSFSQPTVDQVLHGIASCAAELKTEMSSTVKSTVKEKYIFLQGMLYLASHRSLLHKTQALLHTTQALLHKTQALRYIFEIVWQK